MARKLLSLFFGSLILLCCTSCEVKDMHKLIEEAAKSYSGKGPEETFGFNDTGILLDELIKKYSGSYYMPTSTEVTDDEAEKDTQDKDEDESVKEPSEVINDFDDLLDLFDYAFTNNLESVDFTLGGGYKFAPRRDLEKLYLKLQRKDPVSTSGLEYWSVSNYDDEYNIHIVYSFDVDELKKMKKKTYDYVDEAVRSIDVNGMDDVDKICAVNDYLCDNIYYPDEEPYEPITHTAYGALKNGCAVCEGYACAAKLILDKLGIKNDLEAGTCYGGGGHIWNLVYVEDQWYQVDFTWNDGSVSRKDFLLVNDEFMKESRMWEESEYPVCSADNYFS